MSTQVYIVHINRAGIGGEIGGEGYIRHANPVSFPDTLDLRDCGLLLNPDTPLDWNLEPCSTEYDLFGACFHRGKYNLLKICINIARRQDRSSCTRCWEQSVAAPIQNSVG